ncbi:MAG: carboxypeptidase regulatory-like domain-containing protein [Okeania sp. SIO3B3]|nr:carboxypeptidase regulatory-like domain-containing protein [Okeania sp. SIO3B3]
MLALSISILIGGMASAHGVVIDYTVQNAVAIDIQAKFDTGQIMPEAQVTVYAPDDPQTPWLTSTTNENGKFSFTPDMSKPGTWDIQVRKAGHGHIIHVPLEDTTTGLQTTTTTSNGFTTLQIIIMSASVIWGFVGTALYFSQKGQ